MKELTLTLFGVLILTHFVFCQIILEETFDSDAAFTKNTPFFSDGASDYFGIAGASPDFDAGGSSNPSGLPNYTGFSGNYLVGEDLTASFTLTWAGLNISNYSNITFSGDFAQGTVDKIDANDQILIQYQIDNGGYQNLIAFEGADFTSGNLNGNFQEDTDFDGTGDGITLTAIAQTFTKLFSVSGNSLDIKLTISVDIGEEEFAMDNFKLVGTYVGFDEATNSENETNASFGIQIPVTLSNYNGSQVDLSVAVTGGSANASDYTLNTTSLSFTSNGTQNISININPDVDDLDETVEITLLETTSTGSAILTNFHTLTIIDDEAAKLVITEVHYNPNPDSDATHEFLEIYNAGSTTVDLNGYKLSNGISYTFSSGNQIAAGEYIVIARDATTYNGNGYQVFDISGGLNNTGNQTIILESNTGRVLDEVTYNSSHISATSNGSSYELINVNEDNATTASNWQASAVTGGTPGAGNGVTVWIGGVNTAWATAGNWSNGVPTSSLNVYIDDGAANNPVLSSTMNASNLFIENGRSLSLGTGMTLNITNDLEIQEGATFSITDGSLNVGDDCSNFSTFNLSGGVVTVSNDFYNKNGATFNFSNGTLKIGSDFNEGGTLNMTGGTLEFNGTTTDNQKITGINTYYNININNTGGGYVWFLNDNQTISNRLTLTSGNLDIQPQNLTFASGANISGGSSASYIKTSSTGTIKMEVSNSDVIFPIGNTAYNPITLKNAGTTDNFSIRVVDQITENGASGGTAITTNVVNKMWLVEEETAGSSNVTMTLQWNTSDELTNFDRTNCFISHYTAGSWTAKSAAASATGSNPYSLSVGGISAFSSFGVGDNQSALPVDLVFFKANIESNLVKLSWQTASEQKNEGFEIERSENALDFEKIGFIHGRGTVTTLSDYTFIDDNFFGETNYYRLKIIDLDGNYEYSPLVSVNTPSKDKEVAVYPNPAHQELNLVIPNNAGEKITYSIYNQIGQCLKNQTLLNDKPIQQFDILHLVPAMYFLKVNLEGKVYIKSFIKE
jgi:uncharacterized ubiquitin-like protein YukD